MKVKIIAALALLFGGWVSQSVAGGIVLQTTRVIYEASNKEAALPLANRSSKMPYLLQSWIDNPQGTVRGPFIVTPPLFRLNAGDDSSLRIIKTDGQLPEDKESLFYINVRAIPSQNKNEMDKKNNLTLVFKTRIKLFYRPAHLKGNAVDAWKSIEYKRTNNSLEIYNPSAYYVVFAGLALGQTDLTDKIEYIAPGEHKTIPLSTVSGHSIQWSAINDYGGITEKQTQAL